MICWHKWEKWQDDELCLLKKKSDPLTGRLLDEKEEFVVAQFISQKRRCLKCGKLQLRREDI